MLHRYALRYFLDGRWRRAIYLHDRMRAVRYAASLYMDLGIPFDVYDCDSKCSCYSIGLTHETQNPAAE